MKSDEEFLREVIRLARKGMTTGQGGPSGYLIVKDEKVVADAVFQEWMALEKRVIY